MGLHSGEMHTQAGGGTGGGTGGGSGLALTLHHTRRQRQAEQRRALPRLPHWGA